MAILQMLDRSIEIAQSYYSTRKYVPIQFLSIKILMEQFGYAVSIGK